MAAQARFSSKVLPSSRDFKFIATAALVLTAGCGNVNNPVNSAAQPKCDAGTAVIEVQDGFLRNLCGCDETAGTLALAGSSLTCTVSTNTLVVFQFNGATLKHQILSQASPSFVSSPVADPQGEVRVPTYAVKLTSAGTYSFEDAFNSALAGQIVVQ